MVTYNEFMEIISDNKVATTQEQYDITTQTITSVFELIQIYINKHGEIAVSCGSEWLFQDDKAQTDALELVGDILDKLSLFTVNEEDNE